MAAHVPQGIEWSTFWGGSGSECYNEHCAVARDSQGNIYLAGSTGSGDLTTLNPLYGPCGTSPADDPNGCVADEGFVAKFSPSGSLLASTYLPVSDITGIAIDQQDNIYLTGSVYAEPRTQQANGFPSTSNAYQSDCPRDGGLCGIDAFIMRISPAWQLTYASYFGGTGRDEAYAIAVDSAGAVYIAGASGYTEAQPFFPIASAWQSQPGWNAQDINDRDAFVSKLEIGASSTTLVYSTYLGGNEPDDALALAVDASGHAFVGGLTFSGDFPVQSPLQTCNGGQGDSFCWDGFLTKLAPDGASAIFSTYVTGEPISIDSVNGLALDMQGNVYVTGEGMVGGTQGFVAKYRADGTAMLYATAMAADENIGAAIAVDSFGNAYVATIGSSSVDGNSEALALTVSPNGSIVRRVLLSASVDDVAQAILVDDIGSIYLVGQTTSSDFPGSTNAADPTYAGPDIGGDGFIVHYVNVPVNQHRLYIPLQLR